MRALSLLLVLALMACQNARVTESPPPEDTTGASDTTEPPPECPPLSATERLFDDHAPVRHFDVELAQDDWTWLQDNARLEQYVPAAVTFEGQRYEGAGLRFKGGFGSLHGCYNERDELECSKLSLKLKFNEYKDKGRLWGVRKLNFNSSERDPTYLRERLSYALFREADVIAPRAVHATLSVNGGPRRLYVLVEAIDEEFLEDHFDSDEGYLYKEVWPQFLQPEPYRQALKTRESPIADVNRMIAWTDAILEATPATFNAEMDRWLDRSAITRYFVVDQFIQNWDGIWKFYCFQGQCGNHNFYIFDDPASRLMHIIPWDLDHTFNEPNGDLAQSWFDVSPEACEIEPLQIAGFDAGILAPQCDPLLRGLLHQNHEQYLDDFRSLLAGPLTRDALLERLDRYRSQIQEAVVDDPDGPDRVRWQRAVAELRQVIRIQHELAVEYVAP